MNDLRIRDVPWFATAKSTATGSGRSSPRLVSCTIAVTLSVAAAVASAQQFPQKPVRIIIPFAPGGPGDFVVRVVADRLSKSLGQQVVSDNRAGANGNIGMELAAKAPADGYTTVFGSGFTLTLNPHIYQLPYDVQKDFAPITHLVSYPAVLVVNSTLPVKNVKGLIALAKKHPGELTFGSGGAGGLGHISGELLAMLSGVKMLHVPYRSSAPALTDVASGHIAILINNLVTTMPLVKLGKVNALAVTSRERSSIMRDIPTMAEAGVPGYEITSWNGLLAPAGVPKDIIAKWHDEVVRALNAPDVRQRFEASGAHVLPSSPEQFAAKISDETAKMAKIVRHAGLKAN